MTILRRLPCPQCSYCQRQISDTYYRWASGWTR